MLDISPHSIGFLLPASILRRYYVHIKLFAIMDLSLPLQEINIKKRIYNTVKISIGRKVIFNRSHQTITGMWLSKYLLNNQMRH